MSLIGVKIAEANAEIARINQAWRDARATFESDKAALLAKAKSFDTAVVLRLHDFEDGERAWVSKHPLATFVLVMIALAVAFGLGLTVERAVCR